jgi:hypothetical protein
LRQGIVGCCDANSPSLSSIDCFPAIVDFSQGCMYLQGMLKGRKHREGIVFLYQGIAHWRQRHS